MIAVCNAYYEFILDIGINSDDSVFGNSDMGVAFESASMNVQEPVEFPGTDIKWPYVLVRDEAFPLKSYLMKPYPREALDIKERIFNYRLSCARRITENTFGILAARCRIFRKPIIARDEVVINITNVDVDGIL